MQTGARDKLSQAGLAGPLSHHAKSRFVAPTGCIQPSFRESDDTYAGIVTMLAPNWRVICGNCCLQWIVQRCTKGPRLVWTKIAFCATKEGLKLHFPSPVSCDLADISTQGAISRSTMLNASITQKRAVHWLLSIIQGHRDAS
jgi:hypothetical protein